MKETNPSYWRLLSLIAICLAFTTHSHGQEESKHAQWTHLVKKLTQQAWKTDSSFKTGSGGGWRYLYTTSKTTDTLYLNIDKANQKNWRQFRFSWDEKQQTVLVT